MTQRANGVGAETGGSTTNAGDETERDTEITFRMMNPHRTKRRRVAMNLKSSRFVVDNEEILVEIEATEDGVHDVSWCRKAVDISEIRF